MEEHQPGGTGRKLRTVTEWTSLFMVLLASRSARHFFYEAPEAHAGRLRATSYLTIAWAASPGFSGQVDCPSSADDQGRRRLEGSRRGHAERWTNSSKTGQVLRLDGEKDVLEKIRAFKGYPQGGGGEDPST